MINPRFWVNLICVALVALPALGLGQPPTPTRPMTRPGDEIDVYLVTIEPGDELYQRFAHNAIWIRNYHAEPKFVDIAYNYGMFTFGEGVSGLANFLVRFLSGEMDYWVEPTYMAAMVEAYGRENRTIRVQLLEMTPAQKTALAQRLARDIREENRYYRYNYFRSNCSTKVRDALDGALGGQLAEQLQHRRTNRTYRDNTRMILRGDPLYFPINAVLGQKTEEPLSAWDEAYLPMRFYEALSLVWIAHESGENVPLVKEDFVIYPGRAWEMPREVPAYYAWILLLLGMMIGGVMSVMGRFASNRWSRRGLVITGAGWSLLAAFCGWFGVYALTTHHWAAKHNENLLQFSPLALGLLIAILAWARGKPWAAGAMKWLAMACAGSSVLGLLLKVLPMMNQSNWEFIALVVPAQLGLAGGVLWALRSTSPAPAADKTPSPSRKKK